MHNSKVSLQDTSQFTYLQPSNYHIKKLEFLNFAVDFTLSVHMHAHVMYVLHVHACIDVLLAAGMCTDRT